MGFIQKYVTDPIREAAKELRQDVIDEIREQIPVLTKAVVVAIVQTMGELAANKVDQVTDAIPGELDDQIIDPLFNRVADILKGRFGL